jgi:RNA polymerase sigma-70 factor (ECF subfamily)
MDVRGTDHRRFLRHFLREQGALRAYLLASVRDAHQADDLLQEVSSVLWESFGAYDEQRPFRAWALGFARIELLRWKRAQAKGAGVLSEETLALLARTADETASQAELRRSHLGACVESLGEHVRDIVRLRYLESLPVRDLAHRVRKSVAAVEMILVRTRRALRDCVDRKLQHSEEYVS